MSLQAVTLIWLALFSPASALYKQWIPDTNYENATNWDKGSVPCGTDRVYFAAERKVSVYVETVHSVLEMRLPVDGELVLAPGAAFLSSSGGSDPSCGGGVTARFKDSEGLKWFDPGLWRAAASWDDLQAGRYVFSVHEESMPCQQDDVVFRPASSFRVDVSSSQLTVPVQSVTIQDQKFSSGSSFSQYLASRSGKLQFHGSSSLAVVPSGCSDPSGCECGNAANRERICASVACPELACPEPLRPVGHCCDICGAIVSLQFSEAFNLESYRQRLQHLVLNKPDYQSVRLGLSKVREEQRLLAFIPRTAQPKIQVLLLENNGESTSQLAEAAAKDIASDARANGANLGIEEAEIGLSSGDAGGAGAGAVVGVVFAILLVVALVLGVGVYLHRRGTITLPSLPSMPSIKSWRKSSEVGELGGPMDHGFDNPMFDKPTLMPSEPDLYVDSGKSISITQSGVHFVNPAYDETDFNA
ncbi:hypothetical protein AALO_G00078630 [Alosa alosa]|uniref:Protein amnionless n=1 Tax=Alosa alosa TaxID=278164 RepID=A0AAV6H1M9_9TELE|nr:protein amnionless [Alosa alosa]KAG5279517.1 hypothetical protein AALO_G00078630 [Alosa alosa]